MAILRPVADLERDRLCEKQAERLACNFTRDLKSGHKEDPVVMEIVNAREPNMTETPASRVIWKRKPWRRRRWSRENVQVG